MNPFWKKIHGLMKKLSSVKKLAKLRQKTELRPVLRNKNRWTGTFMMVDRFLAIKDFIDSSDVEIASLLPTTQESKTIQTLFDSLKDFHSVTLALEKTDMNLHKALPFSTFLSKTTISWRNIWGKMPQLITVKHSEEESAKLYLEKMGS